MEIMNKKSRLGRESKIGRGHHMTLSSASSPASQIRFDPPTRSGFTGCALLIFICVVILVMLGVVGLLLSYFLGSEAYREESTYRAQFYVRAVENYIERAHSALDSLSVSPTLRSTVCDEGLLNNTSSVSEFLRYTAESMGRVWPHHIRVISTDGQELIRIDLNHSQYAFISPRLYNVSSSLYHEAFSFTQRTSCLTPSSAVTSLKWTTHGPLPNGSSYEYFGVDEFGDHHQEHIENFPLPSLMKLLKPINCPLENGTLKTDPLNPNCLLPAPAYVIMNLRMIYVLNEIESLLDSDHDEVLIINEEGDYIFNSGDRSREFESLTLETSQSETYVPSFDRDWGIGALNRLYSDELTTNVNHEVDLNGIPKSPCHAQRFGFSDLVCCVFRNTPSNRKEDDDQSINSNGWKYQTCNVHSIFHSFRAQPAPLFAFLVLLAVIPTIFAVVGIALWRRAVVASRNRRAGILMELLYPRHVRTKLLRGEEIVPRREPEIGIHFADIVTFCKTTESFSPRTLVAWLGSVMHVIDVLCAYFSLWKVKSMGDEVFVVSNLGNGESGDERENDRHRERLRQVWGSGRNSGRTNSDGGGSTSHIVGGHISGGSGSTLPGSLTSITSSSHHQSGTTRSLQALFNSRRKNQSKREHEHLSRMVTFALLLRYFFRTRVIVLSSHEIYGGRTEEAEARIWQRRRTLTSKNIIYPDLTASLPVTSFQEIQERRAMSETIWLDEEEIMVEMPRPNWRQGVHVGPAVSGVFERGNPIFDLFGPDINFASRMESTCPPGEIQTSENVVKALKSNEALWEKIVFVAKDEIEMKGFGKVVPFSVNEDSDVAFDFEAAIEEMGLDGGNSPFERSMNGRGVSENSEGGIRLYSGSSGSTSSCSDCDDMLRIEEVED